MEKNVELPWSFKSLLPIVGETIPNITAFERNSRKRGVVFHVASDLSKDDARCTGPPLHPALLLEAAY